MTTEKMNVHKALAELKILDDRIVKAINSVEACISNKHSNTKVKGVDIKVYTGVMKSSYDKATDLIKRREAIKRAVVLSNAVTKVTVADKEYTVAEAIEMKNHGMDFKKLLKQKIKKQYDAAMARVKYENELFTLKYFAQTINSLHFGRVEVLDPHSDVSAALFNKVHVESPNRMIEDTVKKIASDNLMMFYPDAGSMKRYSSAVHLPYAFGIKNRDWETGEIKGLDLSGEINQLPGKDILIVDDICSRGGTFYYSAKKLKETGVNKIYLYVTHCENTIYDGELLKSNGLIEKIYTTDTILTNLESPKIELVERFR